MLKKKVLVSLALITPLLYVAMIQVYSYSLTATLSIKPQVVHYETLQVGQRFSINITVANVTNFYGYELKLGFPTKILDVVAVAFAPEKNLPIGNSCVNDSLGLVWMNVSYEGNPITAEGPLTVGIITFKTMAYGEGVLDLYDTKLVDSSGFSIPHETIDGYVAIVRHDVAIANVETSITETYVERLVNITVTAKNVGTATENFTITVYYNETIIETAEITNLTPNMNVTVIFTWNTTVAPSKDPYVIKAQASVVPYETNIANNIYVDGEVKIKILGDVNGDDVVNINDLIAWDAAYGTIKGDQNWNPQADINGDGIVDKSDGIIILSNYHNQL